MKSKNKRNFIKTSAQLSIICMFTQLFGCFNFSDIKNKLKKRKKTSSTGNTPLPKKLNPVIIPDESLSVSVEKALNSRCSSDTDNDQFVFHWGLFDLSKKLSSEQIDFIIKTAMSCQPLIGENSLTASKNILTFQFNNNIPKDSHDYIMIKNGMLQQAVCLICSALGVAMVHHNLGKDGTLLSKNNFGTVKMILGAMKQSYNNSFWSSSKSMQTTSWIKGNLPDPIRDSKSKLFSVLTSIKNSNINNNKTDLNTISQLLWAARGSTPHAVKSKSSGLTIPTWAGKDAISNIFLMSHLKLYRYNNKKRGRPCHSIKEIKQFKSHIYDEFLKIFNPYNCFIVLCTKDKYSRSLWEIGYQFLNILLQAKSLNLHYKSFLLNKSQKKYFSKLHLTNAV